MDTARQISAYTLILVVVLKTFSMVSALVSFELNRQYYAEVLCVNKNRPELACHGKCVLMQKISMQIETEHHRSSDNYLNFFQKIFESIDVFTQGSCESWSFNESNLNTALFDYTACIPTGIHRSIFHPPTI
ncbi:MAG: hypothetical protein KA109_01430 [Saprospiraceae bacterium]|jgi:hypothetical protein|nr:hypothetical protein [Saprospiraceae bacterium]MBK6478693.1 hypothetical protein [Saprospiraceae bacterium]MBK6814187.1 hypothetical protein [Saprospiraceae bacterium]MBK7373629.1 hypothetical protein [Saprospiraceae bacterium]MBK7437300.1 hypothetical protein [Saprospiraceae bacterium]